MHLKPIRSDTDYEHALAEIERLWGAAQGSDAGDRLDVLVALVEAYERERYPIPTPDPIEAIKFRLEQEGKDYRSLIGILGQRTRVYEVMRRDRPLSLNMIRKLHAKLNIPADVLLHPVKLRKRPATPRKRARVTAKRTTA